MPTSQTLYGGEQLQKECSLVINSQIIGVTKTFVENMLWANMANTHLECMSISKKKDESNHLLWNHFIQLRFFLSPAWTLLLILQVLFFKSSHEWRLQTYCWVKSESWNWAKVLFTISKLYFFFCCIVAQKAIECSYSRYWRLMRRISLKRD